MHIDYFWLVNLWLLSFLVAMMLYLKLLLSGKNKQKTLYLLIHRYCSRFTHPGAWFSVSNCKHYKMCLY